MASKRQKQRKEAAAPATLDALRDSVSQPAPAMKVVDFLERHSRVIAIAAVLLATARIVATYQVFNHTSDEPAHLACGIEYLEHGKYTWEPQHPPLARVAVSLLPFLTGSRGQGTPHTQYISMFREGAAILFAGDHYMTTLSLARAGVLPFFWIACLVLWIWGARYYSRAVAATAVLFFTLLPPVLAHSGLATTDAALTAFLASTFLLGRIWLEKPTLRNASLFGISASLMMLSKFSGVVFLPVSAALALGWYWWRARPDWNAIFAALKERVATFAFAVALACMVVWAGYRFTFGPAPFFSFPMPAPQLWAGLKQVKEHNALGHTCYLLGTVGVKGFWDFYWVALFVKTPIGFLLLLAAGVFHAFRKREEFEDLWFALSFSAGIMLVGMFTHINIGIRHVLPIFVGFSLLAAFATVHLLRTATKKSLGAIAGALCVAWFVASSGLAHPDYLAYFNEIAGSTPEEILVDSDLDWGQDELRVAKRLKELHVQEVTFSPYIVGDLNKLGFPKTYNLHRNAPSVGWNVVSVTEWKELQLAPWVDGLPPMERIGKSMLLYNFDAAGAKSTALQ